MTAVERNICILGEPPLVEEYTDLCVGKGFSVQLRENVPDRRRRLPGGVTRVRRPTKTADLALELTNVDLNVKKKNLVELDAVLNPGTPIVSSSVTVTVAQQARWIANPKRLIGIGAFPSFLSGPLLELAASPLTAKATMSAAREFTKAIGKEIALVQDAVGLVMPRILSMIVNEACFAMADQVAPRSCIDDAMKLGAGYPLGPLEWAEKVGPRQIRAVLEALQRGAEHRHYKIAPLLRQAAVRNALPL